MEASHERPATSPSQLVTPHALISDWWYKAIIQTTSEGFFLTDTEGNIIDVNDAFCRMVGYSRDEMLSIGLKGIDEEFIKNPERLPFVFSKIREVGGYSGEVHHKHKDGRFIVVQVNITFLNIPPGYFFCFHRDITQQKQTEKAIKESESRYRSILSSIDDLVLVLDREGRFLCCHPETSKDLLLKPPNLIGKKHSELMPNYLNKSFSTAFRRNMKGRIADYDYCLEIRGKTRWFHAKLSPMMVDGEFSGSVAVIRDITERKEKEEQAKGRAKDLKRMVAKRTRQLAMEVQNRKRAELEMQRLYLQEQELRRQLETKTQERVWFIKSLAHKLKTPLTSLLGASEVLSRNIKEEPWLGLAKNVYQSAEFLKKRVDELLIYVRGQAGMLSMQLEEIDPRMLLYDIYESASSAATLREQHLILEIGENLPMLRADPDKLKQVIFNLLDNATKSCSAGGSITLGCISRDNCLEFCVRDTGCGIPLERQRCLFNPYYPTEGNNGPGGTKHGIGLGLPICRAIVELHGGRIWVESEPGKGSTFRFLIPLDHDQPRGRGVIRSRPS